jgi:uncharacterized membrane protein YphA (DoxX/SURF4 family)
MPRGLLGKAYRPTFVLICVLVVAAICVLIGLVTWQFAVSCFVVVFLSFVTISVAVTGNRQKYDDPTKE